MDNSNQLSLKYSPLGLDPTIISQTYYSTPAAHRDRLLIDENFFFDQYQKVQSNLQNQNMMYNQAANPVRQTGIPGVNNEEFQMNQAIAASLQTNDQATYEPLDLEQKLRKDGEPVGLKNVGNTCYFNSLLQTLYRVVPFYRRVLDFKGDQSQIDKKFQEPHIRKRVKESLEMVNHLRAMFTRLTASDQKYVDPSGVLNKCVDEIGERIKIGEQEDIIEFAVGFFERVDEVLSIENGIHDYGEGEGINNIPKMTIKPGRTMDDDKKANSMFIEAQNMETEDDEDELNHSVSETLKNISPNKGKKSKFDFRAGGVSIFFGKSIPHLHSDDNVQKLQEENFGPIILDPKDSNLYKAWEKAMVSKIENFKDDQGKVIENAEKIEWITSNPGILCFQIRRAYYDVEKKQLSKNNQKFTFNQEIYIDRFNYDNRQSVGMIRSNVRQLESRIEDIYKELNSINNFGDKNQPVDSSLANCINFIEMLQSGKSTVENFPPDLMNALKGSYSKTLQQLKKAEEETSKAKTSLEGEKRLLEDKIKRSYREIEGTKYKLFSIIMHDGTAEYGHYYAFIKDGSKWFKFNDFHVKEVLEAEVFYLAYGGEGNASAYCIFYVNDALKDQHIFPTHQLMSKGATQGYPGMLPIDMINLVKKENSEYQKQLTEFRVKSIVANYSKKIEVLRKNKKENNEMIKENSKAFKPSLKSLPAFADYLMQKSMIPQSAKSIMNWLMLNDIIKKEVTPEKFGRAYDLTNIYENSSLYNILSDKLSRMNSDMKMNDVLLDTDQGIQLETLRNEYIFRVKKCYLFCEILDRLYSCEFEFLFEAAHYFIELGMGKYEKNYHHRAGYEFALIGVIKCFYLYIWLFKSNLGSNIDSVRQAEQLQSLVQFLELDLITKPGYFTQLIILTEELKAVLPPNLKFLESNLDALNKMYRVRKASGEYYKSKGMTTEFKPKHLQPFLKKLKDNEESLINTDPNSLSDDIKNNNRRCNTKPNDLLKDDYDFMKIHLKFNKKANPGSTYDQVLPHLGDMSRYLENIGKLK